MRAARSWRSVVDDNRFMVREGWQALRALDYKTLARTAFKLRYWYWWLLVVAFLVFAVLAAVFREPILVYIQPRREAILSTPFSWLVPIAVLVAVEFPPLAGHSATAVATGAIWGFKFGVAIVFTGTLLGEILCFGAFSTFLRAKAERIEQEKPLYSHLARSVRSASLLDVVCLRLSALPGRVTTAVAATLGISFWLYAVALVTALPKELVFVYAGSLFTSTGSQHTPVLTAVVLVVAALTTLVAVDVILLRAWRFSHGLRSQGTAEEESVSSDEVDQPEEVRAPPRRALARSRCEVDRDEDDDGTRREASDSGPMSSDENDDERARAAFSVYRPGRRASSFLGCSMSC